MPDEPTLPDFRDGMPFLGGATWIDLLNSTLSPDGGLTTLDFLGEDAAFERWAANAGLQVRGDIAAERRAAIALRAALRPAFDRLAAGNPVSKAVIGNLNSVLAEAPFIRQLVSDKSGAGWRLEEQAARKPHRFVAEVVRDFAGFVTDHEAERLKHCDNPACTMVFYDRGKNNRRRWCSAAVCGNRDKVANYRARKARAAADHR